MPDESEILLRLRQPTLVLWFLEAVRAHDRVHRHPSGDQERQAPRAGGASVDLKSVSAATARGLALLRTAAIAAAVVAGRAADRNDQGEHG